MSSGEARHTRNVAPPANKFSGAAETDRGATRYDPRKDVRTADSSALEQPLRPQRGLRGSSKSCDLQEIVT